MYFSYPNTQLWKRCVTDWLKQSPIPKVSACCDYFPHCLRRPVVLHRAVNHVLCHFSLQFASYSLAWGVTDNTVSSCLLLSFSPSILQVVGEPFYRTFLIWLSFLPPSLSFHKFLSLSVASVCYPSPHLETYFTLHLILNHTSPSLHQESYFIPHLISNHTSQLLHQESYFTLHFIMNHISFLTSFWIPEIVVIPA